MQGQGEGGTVLWLAMTGARCVGRTLATQYARRVFESRLSQEQPGWTFVFLKSPFANLPLPLLEGKQRPKYARERTLGHWTIFYGFIIEQCLPILERAKRGENIVALSDGAGHDIAIDATAYALSDEGRKKALDLHHDLVHHLLVKEQLPKPFYYNITASRQTIIRWMLQKFPKLAHMQREELERFLSHQITGTEEYFRTEITGQNKFDLDADCLSMPELANQLYDHAIDLVSGRIQLAA
ncbi:MAG TPA: hypothetical protein VF829_02415 [Candidatus Paceibacterota bacterium]